MSKRLARISFIFQANKDTPAEIPRCSLRSYTKYKEKNISITLANEVEEGPGEGFR